MLQLCLVARGLHDVLRESRHNFRRHANTCEKLLGGPGQELDNNCLKASGVNDAGCVLGRNQGLQNIQAPHQRGSSASGLRQCPWPEPPSK